MDNMTICEKHREYQHIFYLEKMLKEAGYPYFFNFNRDYPDIIWGKYEMQIDIEQRAGFKKPMLEIFCDGLTSEDCMQIIERIFKKINSTP